jgi:SH3-like domain-containing protein
MRSARLSHLFVAIAIVGLSSLWGPARAVDRAVPYWASMRTTAMNARKGPAKEYPIAWLYQRQQLPLKVIRVKESWRMIQDQDGDTGWVLAQFLSPDRTAVVTGKGLAEMRSAAGAEGGVLWQVEPGVVGKLGECAGGWCRLDTGAGHIGYLDQNRLWGVGAP